MIDKKTENLLNKNERNWLKNNIFTIKRLKILNKNNKSKKNNEINIKKKKKNNTINKKTIVKKSKSNKIRK